MKIRSTIFGKRANNVPLPENVVLEENFKVALGNFFETGEELSIEILQPQERLAFQRAVAQKANGYMSGLLQQLKSTENGKIFVSTSFVKKWKGFQENLYRLHCEYERAFSGAVPYLDDIDLKKTEDMALLVKNASFEFNRAVTLWINGVQ